jgi:two-component system, NtrC family, nitrogen regulation response regulator NtrX
VYVRVLATTYRDLQRSVENQEFRQDLYYRLNVFPITVPALRQRKEDIPLLANAFLRRLAGRHGVKPPTVSPSAMQVLQSYDWPGNVRELHNVVERAVILTEPGQEIRPVDLAPMFPSELLEAHGSILELPGNPNGSLAFPTKIVPLEQIEKEYIQHALRQAGGNRTHTAHLLGISIRTLRNKLNQRGEAESQEAGERV